jgi:hypothetical protein
MPLILSFDIGYASIGWCVLSSDKQNPEFLGTGAVTFPSDECLASQRRTLRRTRRHIRSTRQRIERMKSWLTHRGFLSRAELDKPGHPAPFLLAAAALQDHKTLNAWELWTVLRWYAHNRGYDGNSRWSSREEDTDDTEKLTNARQLMEKYQTSTMAETVCACLNLDPAKHNKTISSALPYKTLNAAYPRAVVQNEVLRLLVKHTGRIPGLDEKTLDLLFTPESITADDRKLLEEAAIRLPKRYHGGLLFGQLVPRFDNRIISRCPITWARVYDETIAAEKTDSEARKQADKFAKVPTAKSTEFLDYRFARILANIKADGKPIDKTLRSTLWQLAHQQGRLSSSDIAKAIKSHLGDVPTNLEAYFKLHPDAEEALLLDPVADEVRKAEGSRARLSPFWKHLSEPIKESIIHEWRKNKAISLAWIAEQSGENKLLADAFQKEFTSLKPRKGELRFNKVADYLRATRVAPKIPSGRAPYSRPILRQVVAEVLDGFDPTKANRTTDPENGEDKPANGVLYDLGIPGSRVRQLQAERPTDQLTNNHLVRHRMLILERLLDDILGEFFAGGKAPDQIIVEVARELKEFSGMTAKQIATELNSRLKDFKAAVDYLEKHAPRLLDGSVGRGSILRKCRIAMDLDWFCPFTGEKYDATDLPKLEREHIIPYATRNTNALHALVLTWPAINRMKGKRTAKQFIQEFGGKQVIGMERLSIFTPRSYETFVDRLDTKGHPYDARRKKARKALLSTLDFEDKELGFTEGQLTQTSQLMKLAMGAIRHKLPSSAIHPIPGPVTAEIRKSWRLTGALAQACPEVLDENGEVRPKDEIRSLTHLHHALDAAAIALAAHYFPLAHSGQDQKGKIWQAFLKRNRTPEEKEFLYKTGIFKRYERPRKNAAGEMITEQDVRLQDIPADLKNALARSLAENRVMQHIPADRTGTKAELTTWGVTSIEGEGTDARVKLHQRTTTVQEGRRKTETKTREERAGKLLGPHPKNSQGKLKAIKGAMIIGENYGLALDPEPSVIPFHQVQQHLDELRLANGGKPVRVLRNGMQIRILSGANSGTWKIFSAMGNMKLKIAPVDYVTWDEKRLGAKKVALAPILKAGLEILGCRYVGQPVNSK